MLGVFIVLLTAAGWPVWGGVVEILTSWRGYTLGLLICLAYIVRTVRGIEQFLFGD